MTEARKHLLEIYDTVVDLRDYLENSRVDNSTSLTRYKKTLMDLVKSFKTRYHKDKQCMQDIINQEPARLFKIHDILVGKAAKLYIKDTSTFRQVHDILFTECLGIKVPRKRFANLATQLATKLCEGLTYFANDTGIQEVPFYHRDTSCGPKDRRNMSRKEFVRMCYIERLIYDAVYTFVFYEQDVKHLIELRNIERLFQDHFKGHDITVKVSASDDLHPDIVFITSINPLYILPAIERYVKNNDRIECYRFSHDLISYHKTQTFQQESPWIEI